MERAPREKTTAEKQADRTGRLGMIDAALRPGYTALVTARTLSLKDEAWLLLMRDVLQLPAWDVAGSPTHHRERIMAVCQRSPQERQGKLGARSESNGVEREATREGE
jgi:hypothetical protein